MKRYESIWKKLKEQKEVRVRCRTVKMRTLIQGVKKLKAAENAPRMNLELPSYGKLSIDRHVLVDKTMAEVTFKLILWNRAEDM